MEWPTVVLVLGVLALLAAVAVGGTVKIKKDGIEYDTKGFLDWLTRAREQKKAGLTTADTESRSLAAASPDPAAVAKQLGPARVPRARVLWTDDHPLNNLYERQALASLGIFADSYTHNAQAEQAMALARYDLVVSDIGRDGVAETGWDLLAAFRRDWPGTPFVLYVGYVDDERRSRASADGARGITANPDELIRLVVEALASPSSAVPATDRG